MLYLQRINTALAQRVHHKQKWQQHTQYYVPIHYRLDDFDAFTSTTIVAFTLPSPLSLLETIFLMKNTVISLLFSFFTLMKEAAKVRVVMAK